MASPRENGSDGAAPVGQNARSAEGALGRELASLLSPEQVVTGGPDLREALSDGTANQGIEGEAELLALPASTEEVAAVLGWCYRHDVPVVTRGGGTGLAAGAVPHGGVVLSTERLDRVRSMDPGLWRMEAEAGVRTATIHRIALENGLFFPPDPGAGEQSTLGGNIATNAGGPHTFKYGVTKAWVTGLEAVIAPGEILKLGGPVRKDVSGLDLLDLLIGSEGTLGIVTAAWLRLVPAPEARAGVVAFFEGAAEGCEAIISVMGTGIQSSTLEFLDHGALEASLGSFPFDRPERPGFAVIAEADGHPDEVSRVAAELEEVFSQGGSSQVLSLAGRSEIGSLWDWRDRVSPAVAAKRGGKISEDVVVPLERFGEAVAGTLAIGERNGLEACSWGHAGDGNLHSTFLVDLDDPEQMERGRAAAGQLFSMAIELGGSISGEHGIGSLKLDRVTDALDRNAVRLQAEVKKAFDPKLLLNPGKKVPLTG
ncbi:MAG: FAD-binding protein [Thermoleophilia bacterium]|nr:FAD-binding protein [Thermoleophilia bacterium]